MIFLDNSKLDFVHPPKPVSQQARSSFVRLRHGCFLEALKIFTKNCYPKIHKAVSSLAGKIENQPGTRKIPNFGLSQNLG